MLLLSTNVLYPKWVDTLFHATNLGHAVTVTIINFNDGLVSSQKSEITGINVC